MKLCIDTKRLGTRYRSKIPLGSAVALLAWNWMAKRCSDGSTSITLVDDGATHHVRVTLG